MMSRKGRATEPAPRVFISSARDDGEDFAKQLRQRIEREEPEITLWRDREEMVGGVGWWKQITEAIDAVEFMVLVMTPAAVASDICRKEWRYARQQGVCVVPVKVPDRPLEFDKRPKWMSTANFMDLDHQWELFTNQLKSPCLQNRVPFMAPDLPEGFVERPKEFDNLIHQVLDTENENPVAITTALQGAGGFGKTTLAAALCYDEIVISAFFDGILWVTLGEAPNVLNAITKLYAALTGERPGFVDEEDAANSLDERLADKHCLIVIDDVWNAAHLRPLLRGGKNCTRLITTRHLDIARAGATPVLVNEMTSDEAIQMLGKGVSQCSPLVPPEESHHAERDDYTAEALSSLATRLGEWPLMLELAAAMIRERQMQGQSIEAALEHVKTVLDRRGVTALDSKDAAQRNDAVAATMGLSLDELDEQEQTACRQLAIFPEDIDIPLSAVAALWEMDEFDTGELAKHLADRAFFRFNLEAGTLRLHDIVRQYLGEQLSDTASLHGRLADGWNLCGTARSPSSAGNAPSTKKEDIAGQASSGTQPLPDEYAWRWYAYHLRHAERQDELRGRLADFHWLEAKLRGADVNSLIADFDYLDDLDWLRPVRDALRMSAHTLSVDNRLLPSQLAGRLRGLTEHYPRLTPLVDQVDNLTDRIWLCPTLPTLVSADSPLIQTLEGHTDSVSAVAITPDGVRAVSASEDNTLKVWDLASGREEKTLEGHSRPVSAVAITPDGARAVVLRKTIR